MKRMTEDELKKTLAVSALIVACEKIVRDGLLPEDKEFALRIILVDACKALGITPLAERGNVVAFPGSETGAYAP